MSTRDTLFETFATALNVSPGLISEELKYNAIPQWDSVAHMTLIAALEDRFDIMLDTDDIIDMSSVGKAMEILERYGVEFE